MAEPKLVNQGLAGGAKADDALVQRARRGDCEAMSQLVTRYQDRVYNAVYRMCAHEADALDLTQSTFLKAFAAIGRFESRSGFYTWLFRIAVNLTLSHRRASRRRRAPLSLDGIDGEGDYREPPADEAADPAWAAAERGELRERLEAALGRLDEDFRAAVVLKDIEQMDYAEIAEVMDVPIGTVKSRIHRGRSMLRKLLSEYESN
jgi:RNA polymerase sigma-70 factor (ECF subfamily)